MDSKERIQDSRKLPAWPVLYICLVYTQVEKGKFLTLGVVPLHSERFANLSKESKALKSYLGLLKYMS